MSKGNTFENDLALLIFNAIPITGLADIGVSSPATTLYVSLHTGILDETSNQSSSEAAYSGYARVAVSRDAAGWTVAGGVAENTQEVIFPTALADGIPATYAAIGLSPTGAGKVLHYGLLVDPLNIYTGTTPKFTVGHLRAGEE